MPLAKRIITWSVEEGVSRILAKARSLKYRPRRHNERTAAHFCTRDAEEAARICMPNGCPYI